MTNHEWFAQTKFGMMIHFGLYAEVVGERTGLYEVPATLNKTWSFKYFDDDWKDAEQIIATKERLNSNGINYLLNIGHNHLGRLPAPAVDILNEVGSRGK